MQQQSMDTASVVSKACSSNLSSICAWPEDKSVLFKHEAHVHPSTAALCCCSSLSVCCTMPVQTLLHTASSHRRQKARVKAQFDDGDWFVNARVIQTGLQCIRQHGRSRAVLQGSRTVLSGLRRQVKCRAASSPDVHGPKPVDESPPGAHDHQPARDIPAPLPQSLHHAQQHTV